QAEDGIRDFHVTGVQTCALPICSHGILCESSGATGTLLWGRLGIHSIFSSSCASTSLICALMLSTRVPIPPSAVFNASRALPLRSEERRVGKECDSRGSK